MSLVSFSLFFRVVIYPLKRLSLVSLSCFLHVDYLVLCIAIEALLSCREMKRLFYIHEVLRQAEQRLIIRLGIPSVNGITRQYGKPSISVWKAKLYPKSNGKLCLQMCCIPSDPNLCIDQRNAKWTIFFSFSKICIWSITSFVACSSGTSTFAKACEDLEKWSTVRWSWAYRSKPDLCACQVRWRTRDDCFVARPRSMSRANSHQFRLGAFCAANTAYRWASAGVGQNGHLPPWKLGVRTKNLQKTWSQQVNSDLIDLILAMTVHLPVWHSHCTRARFTVLVLCDSELAFAHVRLFTCRGGCERIVVIWSLLRNNNMATNLQKLPLTYGNRRFFACIVERRHLGR